MAESYPTSFACCALSGPYKPKAQSPTGPRSRGILFYVYNTKNPKEGHSVVRLTQKSDGGKAAVYGLGFRPV